MFDENYTNKKLKSKFGSEFDGKTKFRIVWSTDETEKRLSTFRDYTENGIFLREVTEVREVRKYPGDKDKWILEKTVQYSMPGLENHNGYEPVWVFQWADESYQEPNWRAVNLLCIWLTSGKFTTKSEYVEQDEKEKEAEREAYFEILGGKSGIGDAITAKSAVMLDSTKQLEN